MKGSKLPLYLLVSVIALALIYAIANPPAPPVPGPVGSFPTWKSAPARGTMTSQSINSAGTMWAGGWSQQPEGKPQESAVHIIDLNGFSAQRATMDKGAEVRYLSWGDGDTLRAVASASGSEHIIYLDGKTGKQKRSVTLKASVRDILCWPTGSGYFAAVVKKTGKTLAIAALSDSGEVVGKEISFTLPDDASLGAGAGIAADGSSLVFAIADPSAKDGKSFYLADTRSGSVKRMFDLAGLPGKVEGIWPSSAGVLFACEVRAGKKDRIQVLVYDTAAEKLSARPKGVDPTLWPDAPKSIAIMTYDGGIQFDLASGKTKTLFDSTKKDSAEDKGWREFMRDSRLYKLDEGGYAAISETGGVVDIRQIEPDGGVGRAMLSRM